MVDDRWLADHKTRFTPKHLRWVLAPAAPLQRAARMHVSTSDDSVLDDSWLTSDGDEQQGTESTEEPDGEPEGSTDDSTGIVIVQL